MKNILIANRGEIARRVIRSAHENCYVTTAVHSPHDLTALYARESDLTFALKGNTPRESYLDQDQIFDIAKKSNADGIHPGYGFLSENSEFAERARSNKIVFIGPSPEAMELLGDKTKARALARRLSIPTPGGTTEALQSAGEAATVAKTIGYPVLLKAAAGGGGKGMRVVNDESGLAQNLERAKSEALSAFGDDRVYIEKYILKPRHIEIQILADQHGNVVHLGERECSLQRRHQKLVEESPSVIVSPALREQMGEAAKTLIREAKYHGAATVEFLLDQESKFYFLEVNTRLQVEHPVTEFVTGLDLVREQFRIAEGEKLGYTQKDIIFRGHSLEVRIQAESVWDDFLPSIGRVGYVRHPGGQFVRNDSALFPSLEVSGFYDSLLAKLIVWDTDRDRAVRRLDRALREYRIEGVSTTIPFGIFVCGNDRFKSGDISTAFIETEFRGEVRDELREKMLTKRLSSFVAARKTQQEENARKLFVRA